MVLHQCLIISMVAYPPPWKARQDTEVGTIGRGMTRDEAKLFPECIQRLVADGAISQRRLFENAFGHECDFGHRQPRAAIAEFVEAVIADAMLL